MYVTSYLVLFMCNVASYYDFINCHIIKTFMNILLSFLLILLMENESYYF